MSQQTLQVWDAELGYSRVALEARPDGGPVAEVDPSTVGAEPMWGVWMTNAEGGVGVMVMPHSLFEWRCAEYGIDPDDLDTLLDVALHEPGIPHPDDPGTQVDPAAAAILEQTRGLPTWATPGVSAKTRLEAHLERIRLVKQHRLLVEMAPRPERQGALDFVGAARVAPVDPLEPIRGQARIDPIRVASKAMALDWRRETTARTVRPNFTLKPPLTFLSAAETGGGA